MSETSLITELGASKKELYLKYKEYQKTKKLTDDESVRSLSASVIFDIDPENKPALFFLMFGLRSIESEIEFIIKEINNE